MQEAFKVLANAKRSAEARLRQYEAEGKAAEHKLTHVRWAIKELDEALKWLTWADEQKRLLIKLWQQVEEGNRNVHVSSSTKRGPRAARRAK